MEEPWAMDLIFFFIDSEDFCEDVMGCYRLDVCVFGCINWCWSFCCSRGGVQLELIMLISRGAGVAWHLCHMQWIS